ncbi:MAG TPA: hypothetical protein VK923_12225 [Euzebyales bacterium]|nr:hypothetical protein [Euzebyales bacterium]
MRSAILMVLLLVATACGSSSVVGTGDATPAASASAVAADTLVGTLGGDPALEGGCVWLETDDGRVEVVWPQGYTASADPLQLRGPDGEVVAAEGDEVRIEGTVADDRVSVCQVGTIWTAMTVEAG